MSKKNYVDFRALKQAVSMTQILAHYNLTPEMKRHGDSLSGKCPIHKGDNPTEFRVSVSKNCWNCFSQCGGGGNSLDFVSKMESVSIREAALRIAGWFNIPLTAPPKKADKRDSEMVKTPEAARPVADPRESADDDAPNKPLGFALQNLDQTHPYFAERGLELNTVVDFGLGFCSKGSMTGRIVIPINNPQGQTVAYAGRWPGDPPEGTPKYKLPPGFRKSRELFNIERAIQEPSDEPLVIVEGFFDCIHLWRLGVRRVVALMGSTMSSAQESLLAECVDHNSQIVVMLDEDEAGRAGRADLVQRLARTFFVKCVQFDGEGFQPDQLTEDQLFALMSGGDSNE